MDPLTQLKAYSTHTKSVKQPLLKSLNQHPQISMSLDHSDMPGDGDNIPQQGMGAEIFSHGHHISHQLWPCQGEGKPWHCCGKGDTPTKLCAKGCRGAGKGAPCPLIAPELPTYCSAKVTDFVSLCHELPLGHFWSKAQKNLQHFLI